MAIALYIFSPWLAANTLAAPHLTGLLRISALLLFLVLSTGHKRERLRGLI